MKKTMGILLAIALGLAVGLGSAAWRIYKAAWNPVFDQGPENAAGDSISSADRPRPKVRVPETAYNFGTLDISSSGSHDFVFLNEGQAPLRLTVGSTSCRCAVGKLDRNLVAPGESAKVHVTWKPKASTGPYEQTAQILTNDRDRRRVTLSISGTITMALEAVPSDLVLSHVTASERSTAEARLYCYLDQPLKVLGPRFSDPATAPSCRVAMRPLRAGELKERPPARSGQLVTVSVGPGLPEGFFRQKLTFQTNVAACPQLGLTIQATVTGEIAVAGPNWDSDTGVLSFGTVASRTGARRRLFLIVRGPLRNQVTFRPVKIAPETLSVSLGRRSELNGTVTQTPLEIAIPPGAPAENHLGSDQGKLGQIILETTHPGVPKLRILVRFVVES